MATRASTAERAAPRPGGERGRGLLLLAVLALALAARLLYWQRAAAMFNDGPLYLDLAGEFAAGDWSSALRHPYHPLYPLATALVHLALPDWERAAVAVSVAAGVLSVLFLYAFVRDAFDPRSALLAALLLAVHPYAIRFSADVLSDGLYLICFLAAIAALYAADRRRSTPLAAWAGIAAGLAYLARPEGLGLMVLGLALAGAGVLTRRRSAARALPWAGALVAGGLLVLAPYVGALRVETGVWRLTQKKSVEELAGVELPEPMQDLVGRATVPGAGRDAVGDRKGPVETTPPGSEVPLPGYRRYRAPEQGGLRVHLEAAADVAHTALSALRPEIALLALLGLVACRGRPGPRALLVLGAVVLYGGIVYLLRYNAGYVSRRHLLPPLVLVFGYAAVGASVSAAWLERALACLPRVRAPARPALGLVLLAVASLGLGKALRPSEADHLAARRAAEWFRAQPLEEGSLAAQKRRVAWYAEAPFFPLRAAPEAGFVPYLRARGVRYVIAEFGGHQGLEAALARNAVRVLHREEAGGHRVGVFELPAEAGERGPGAGVGRD